MEDTVMEGTVIEGTHRRRDLIPRFVDVLDFITEESTFESEADKPERVKRLDAINDRLGQIERNMKKEGYYGEDDSDYDLEWLFDTLDSFAKPGWHFGAHPGDGADFGFWPNEEGE